MLEEIIDKMWNDAEMYQKGKDIFEKVTVNTTSLDEKINNAINNKINLIIEKINNNDTMLRKIITLTNMGMKYTIDNLKVLYTLLEGNRTNIIDDYEEGK